MKLSFLSFLIAGVTLSAAPMQIAFADDMTTSNVAAPAPGSTNTASGTAPAGEQGQRMEKLKAAIAQLDLTDAQKDQIKQIRATVTDRKERRQQIIAVLTPDQKAKLMAMWQARKGGEGAGAAAGTGDNQ